MTGQDLDALFHRILTDTRVDPRPLYAEIREAAPMYKTPYGFWWSMTYDLSSKVLLDTQNWTVDNAMSATGQPPHTDSYAMQVWYETIITFDGPRHRRLRELVRALFKPSAVREMRARIEQLVGQQLDEMADQSEIELRFDFAELMPTKVILELLGIDAEHTQLFADVSECLAQMVEPDVKPETLQWGNRVWRDAGDVVLQTAAQRKKSPREDLLTGLVEVGEDTTRLTESELVAMVLVLNVAGQETTGQQMCSGMYHLLQNPDELEALRNDRSLMGGAIEETLRYDSATRSTAPRFAINDMMLGDQLIRKGEGVSICQQGANHDPAEFADPLNFDIRRKPNRHLGLGTGAHHCLGAALARLELDVAWNAILDRYPHIEVASDDIEWKPRFMVRGMKDLPLRVSK